METARCLAARGHDVTLFTAGSEPFTGLADGYTLVRFRRRYAAPQRHERWFARKLMLPIVRGRYDVVHSLMPRDALAAVRVRRFHRHRVVYEDMGSPLRSWMAAQPDRRVRRRLIRAVDVYGCMSRFSLDVLKVDWDRDGVLIPGGVRLDEFQPTDEREPRPTVLFSGAISEERKGVGVLLKAVSQLARVYPELQLWLSGPGDPRPFLVAADSEARTRTVHLGLGEPGQQAERYARAWVTALPSKGDSFGMALIESLACGTPIVVADDGAPPELVTATTGAIGGSGDDISALTEALAQGLELARDPKTADRCRAVAATYDWDAAMGPRLERVYSALPEPLRSDLAERLRVVERVLADPPVVHPMSPDEDSPSGVWSTDEDCYRFMAELCEPGTRTLETGSGISTVLFAAWGTDHVCVTPAVEEKEAVENYCERRGIPTDRLAFEIAYSDAGLTRLASEDTSFDLMLIDGCHGFPAPILDWYFGASRLQRGGVVIVDDVQLPAVRGLLDFVIADPRWRTVRRSEKWAAFERRSSGPLTEDWFLQPFYQLPEPGWRYDLKRAKSKVRRMLSPVKRSLLSFGRDPQ